MSDSIYATHKPKTGGSGYFKLADGETQQIRIASEPAIYETESKPDDQGKTKLTTRYAWVIYNRTVGEAQIMQMSATFFNNLAGFAQDDEYGDPEQYDLKITRRGVELNTEYTIIPGTKKEPLGVAELEAVKAIELVPALKASPFTQRAALLSEFENNGGATAATEAKGPSQQQQAEIKDKQTEIQDIGNDPINLDDIPF